MSLRRQITETSHLIYAAYCRGRLGQIPQGNEDAAQLAAQVLGAQDQARSPEIPLPTAAGLAERVADQLDPPALSKPVSGAALTAEAAKPGYRAPELREQAAALSKPSYSPALEAVAKEFGYTAGDLLGQAVQEWAARRREQAAQAAPRPARPSPRTARCIGCRGTGQGVPAPQSHARACPDYTEEDEAWCLTQYSADNRGTMLSYEEALEAVRRDSKHPPRADGVGAVEVKVGEQAAPLRAVLLALVAGKDIYAEGMLGEVVHLLAADLERLLGASFSGLLAAARALDSVKVDWDRRNIPADLGAWWAGKVRAKQGTAPAAPAAPPTDPAKP